MKSNINVRCDVKMDHVSHVYLNKRIWRPQTLLLSVWHEDSSFLSLLMMGAAELSFLFPAPSLSCSLTPLCEGRKHFCPDWQYQKKWFFSCRVRESTAQLLDPIVRAALLSQPPCSPVAPVKRSPHGGVIRDRSAPPRPFVHHWFCTRMWTQAELSFWNIVCAETSILRVPLFV